jgi:hypothetical protein
MPQMPQKPSGLGGLLPQQNLDFLNKLPKNMMPNLDFSNLPQNMRPGYAVGGPLMGRAANLSRQVLNKSRIGRSSWTSCNWGDLVLGTRGASIYRFFKTRY